MPSAQAPISVTASAGLVDQAWANRKHAWAILPFDQLEPRWKVLRVDGASVLDKALEVDKYPLSLQFGLAGKETPSLAAALMPDGRLLTNRDTERMTVLIMTGVTAMTRSTAARMEEQGILYPAEKVGALLRSADLTHISNEVPFTEECPTPDFHSKSLTFCSSPRYVELLRAIGTDIVELTGNHVHDYGAQAMLETLEIYRREGWPYFGGGKNLEEARRPLVIEKNGNKLAFIGCNPVGPAIAWATADGPGAAPCDYEYVHAELAKLKAQVDVPIATLQYWEFELYEPTDQQRADFRGLVDAGAVIVSGSQAHQPQGFEFYKGGFIHYGLGNLFFDQMWSLGTRQEVIDRHVIYQGRHISTELYTYMLEDYSQPRPMTAKERQELLSALFKASGW
jgi:poly-gamma-glutamate synthesis protein (capsule biosynthesis protein)